MSNLYQFTSSLGEYELGLQAGTHSSVGASSDAVAISKSLMQIVERQQSPGTTQIQPASENLALSERLFNALAVAKVSVSKIAMHMNAEWRSGLFYQLDELLSEEDWFEDDAVLNGSSFATFLRVVLYLRIQRRPGLGISDRGNLIAAWDSGPNRLTIEFFPKDVCRWILSCRFDADVERSSGQTVIARLPKVLSPYSPDQWFTDADTNTA